MEQIQTFVTGLSDWFKKLFSIIEEFLTRIGVDVK